MGAVLNQSSQSENRVQELVLQVKNVQKIGLIMAALYSHYTRQLAPQQKLFKERCQFYKMRICLLQVDYEYSTRPDIFITLLDLASIEDARLWTMGHYAVFEILTAVTMKNTVFCFVILCEEAWRNTSPPSSGSKIKPHKN
jgi:hypothetical protein